jgi:hypothetical protein
MDKILERALRYAYYASTPPVCRQAGEVEADFEFALFGRDFNMIIKIFTFAPLT